MGKGLCNLAQLVRFDKRNEEGELIGRVVEGEPRSGVLKEPDFTKPDAYFCKRTGRECVACNITATSIMGEFTYCSTSFNSREAKKCPLYSAI